MDFTTPTKNTLCKRVRYYTGKERPVGTTLVNNVLTPGAFHLEPGGNGGTQIIGGRAYLCSFYAYTKAYVPELTTLDVWVFLYDCTAADSITALANPRMTWRVPAANQPDTVWYEAAEAEIDSVVYGPESPFMAGSEKVVGAYFENGIRCYVSSTGDSCTPITNWGYIPKCDMVTLVDAPGKVV